MVQTCFSLENYSSNPSNSSFVKIASVIFGRIFLLNKKTEHWQSRKHSFYFNFFYSVFAKNKREKEVCYLSRMTAKGAMAIVAAACRYTTRT